MNTSLPTDHRRRPRRHRGEGTYWQRTSGVWVFTMKLDGGGSRSVSAATKRELQPKVENLKREIARSVGKGGNTILAVWARYWLDEICVDRVGPTTLMSHRSKVENHIIPALGRRKLRDITPEHVRALYRSMVADGYKTATIRQVHVILSRCLKVAVMDGKIERNPCENVEPPKPAEKPYLPPVNLQDAALILAWLRKNGTALETARWSIALLGGLRQGEALALTWENVDLKKGVIPVTQSQAFVEKEFIIKEPKSASSKRTVPMMNDLKRDLQNLWMSLGKPSTGLIFGPKIPYVDRREWDRIQIAAKVSEQRNIHACRKTTASLLAAAGVPSRLIADILGQANTEVTDEHYVHTEIENRREAIDRGNAVLSTLLTEIPAHKLKSISA